MTITRLVHYLHEQGDEGYLYEVAQDLAEHAAAADAYIEQLSRALRGSGSELAATGARYRESAEVLKATAERAPA